DHRLLPDPSLLQHAGGNLLLRVPRDELLGLEPADLVGQGGGAHRARPDAAAGARRVRPHPLRRRDARPGRAARGAGDRVVSSTAILVMMFGGLTLFMLTGLPIAFVLGGLSLLFTVTLWNDAAVVVLVLQIFDTMKSEALLAIPLFILMACILQRSGVIESLYRAMELWFGRVRGGLAVGTVIICVIMAAMTGVVGAAVTAMGILALP